MTFAAGLVPLSHKATLCLLSQLALLPGVARFIGECKAPAATNRLSSESYWPDCSGHRCWAWLRPSGMAPFFRRTRCLAPCSRPPRSSWPPGIRPVGGQEFMGHRAERVMRGASCAAVVMSS